MIIESFQQIASEISEDVMRRVAPHVADSIARLVKQTERITYTEREAAEILGLSIRALADLRRAGKIFCYQKVGNGGRYGRHHLEEFLNRHDTMPARRRAQQQQQTDQKLRVVS